MFKGLQHVRDCARTKFTHIATAEIMPKKAHIVAQITGCMMHPEESPDMHVDNVNDVNWPCPQLLYYTRRARFANTGVTRYNSSFTVSRKYGSPNNCATYEAIQIVCMSCLCLLPVASCILLKKTCLAYITATAILCIPLVSAESTASRPGNPAATMQTFDQQSTPHGRGP